MIKQSSSFKLVGALQGTHTIGQHATELLPDVILADLEHEAPLVNQNGLPIVALIDNPSAAWTAQALRSGVRSILARDAAGEEIVSAIHAAYAGLVLLDPDIAEALSERIPGATSRVTSHEELTARELEVLAMLAEGLPNREIADRLGVSEHTVKFHISSILDKLGAATRTEAVTLGLRMGLILL
jgi:DNA-binding NarL/FixJ family response regulator